MHKKKTKYIFVVGGVMSSVGKGIAAASIAKILQSRGYRVANLKADMYVNLDAGTIRPAEHGEVFVGDDGIEADQDLGNYERFIGQTSTRENYITTGQIYAEVIRRERNLEYELLPFLEAARMMKSKPPGDVFIVLISYLPTPTLLGEQKSKPTQHAITDLFSVGLSPDFVICRADHPATPDIKRTISNVCSLPVERIISAPDVYSIYDVPVNFEKENFGATLLRTIGLPPRRKDLADWTALAKKIKTIKKEVRIGIVGKYFNFKSCKDTYISVIESINHAAWNLGYKPEVLWLDSEKYEKDPRMLNELDNLDGILVPGGFGKRGIEGMILAADYARRHGIPYFGLCLGMQIMTISYARNVLGFKCANSTEMDADTAYPVIATMADQIEKIKNKNYGATMRLGAYKAVLQEGTVARGSYGKKEITERHRHRYEVNPKYVQELEKAGLVFSGRSPDGVLMEIAELPKREHLFYLGTQFHPEFLSRPLHPHPLFSAFVKACIGK